MSSMEEVFRAQAEVQERRAIRAERARYAAYQRGREDERREAVAWLRSVTQAGRDGYLTGSPRIDNDTGKCEHGHHRWEDCAECEALNIADALEAGEHVHPMTETPRETVGIPKRVQDHGTRELDAEDSYPSECAGCCRCNPSACAPDEAPGTCVYHGPRRKHCPEVDRD